MCFKIRITSVTPELVANTFMAIINTLSLEFMNLISSSNFVVLKHVHQHSVKFFYVAEFGEFKVTVNDASQLRAMLKSVAAIGILTFQLIDSIPNSDPSNNFSMYSITYINKICNSRLMTAPKFVFSSEKLLSELIYICSLKVGPFICHGRASNKDLARKSAILLISFQLKKFNYIFLDRKSLSQDEVHLLQLRSKVEDGYVLN